MKKKLFVSLVLVLALAVTGCMAESIFKPMAEEKNEENSLTAPSYGAMANVDPDQVEASAEGGTIVTYNSVDASGYNSFGTYLGKLGFSVTNMEEQENRIAYAISDGRVNFVMIYDQNTQTMQLVYPLGTGYAESTAPEYTRIEFNEAINVPGLGRFTFMDFSLNDHGSSSKYNKDGRRHDARDISSWFSFHLYNNSTDYLYCSAYGDNIFSHISLEYHNQDADYTFYPEKELRGIYDAESKTVIPTNAHAESQAPLEERDYALVFDLPYNLRTSTDGTILIKLILKTGEKYVLVARENGVDMNIVTATDKE